MACFPQASHLGPRRGCYVSSVFFKALTPFFLSFPLFSTHLHLGRQGRTKRLFYHNFRVINLMSRGAWRQPLGPPCVASRGGGVSGSQWCLGDHEILFKSLRLGWRVVSEVKSTGSSSRGPGFNPQPAHILHRHKSDSTEHPTVHTPTPVDPDAATCPLYPSVHRVPSQELLLRAHACLFIITVFPAI